MRAWLEAIAFANTTKLSEMSAHTKTNKVCKRLTTAKCRQMDTFRIYLHGGIALHNASPYTEYV